jgi:hypothetical protein
MGRVSAKKLIGTKNGYFPDFHFGIQEPLTAMSICAGCPLAQKPSMTPRNDTPLQLVKSHFASRLRPVPRIAAEEECETTPETGNID